MSALDRPDAPCVTCPCCNLVVDVRDMVGVDGVGECRECSDERVAQHDDAADEFCPADEALFCAAPSIAELDAWGREQLDELHANVALYAVGGGR
mgnify:CR=1 FL=1